MEVGRQLTFMDCRILKIAYSRTPRRATVQNEAFRPRHEEAGEEFDLLTAIARYHDIVVLPGGHNRIGGLPSEAVGEVIMGSGRAVPEEEGKGPFNRIAIAWKDTAEAARAVTAAMPLLESAHQIEVLSVCGADKHAAECVNTSNVLVRYLRWHGLLARTQFLVPEGRTPADAALDQAKHAAADLLIMVLMGTAECVNSIFGGFTEHILKGVELPVLFFH
jgi:hypothetical protein